MSRPHSQSKMPSVYMYWTLFLFSLLFGDVTSTPRVDPLVNTNLGLIRGVKADSGDYSMFLGIPFAQVNASNPFGAAIPQAPFDEIFDATDDSAICPQIEEFNNTIVGSLDCLDLNLYVPTVANSRNKVPVLVWIYGGGFNYGYAGRYIYGPKFIVRHDVIFVTLNYRVGPYGFMCLDTPENPGNQGFKDQVLALKWIKNNIEAFGGDSNKITIFGESAGGIAVDFHLLYTKEKLFDQAIIQSATSLSPVFFEPHKDGAFRLAAQLGLVTDNVNDTISYLATIDTDLVIAATKELGLNFRPCMEKQFEGVEGFITENWIYAKIPKVKRMPILIGFTDDEKFSVYLNQPPSYFENLNVFYDKLYLGFDADSPEFVGMEKLMRQFYIGDEDVSANVKKQIADFDSDYTYIHPTYRSISKYLSNDAGSIYHYIFSYNGGRNFGKRTQNFTNSDAGAVHADEIGYLFDTKYYDEEPTHEDQIVIDRITTMWTNFAKYGNPTPETSDLLAVEWTPITKNTVHYYLDINSDLNVRVNAFNKRMAFWNAFYQANEKLQRMYPGSE